MGSPAGPNEKEKCCTWSLYQWSALLTLPSTNFPEVIQCGCFSQTSLMTEISFEEKGSVVQF